MGRQGRRIETTSLEETKVVGRMLGQAAQKGWILCLDGPMGAGKTALSQGILHGLGVEGYVTSPTFSIVHTYEGTKGKVHHFDVYRLLGGDDLWDLGFEEYLKDSVVVMEWASLVRQELDGAILDIHIQPGDSPNQRWIVVEGDEEIMKQLKFHKGWDLL